MADRNEKYKSGFSGSDIDAAVRAVIEKESEWDAKQDKLTGLPGQVVGFDAEGNPVPQSTNGLAGPQDPSGEQSPEGSGGATGGEVYSTEETRIGTWIDGKPLYRKIIYLELANTATTQNFQYDFSDIDKITSLKAIFRLPSGEFVQTNYFVSGTDLLAIYASPNQNKISVACGSPERSSTGYAFMEYTKTTDEATL